MAKALDKISGKHAAQARYVIMQERYGSYYIKQKRNGKHRILITGLTKEKAETLAKELEAGKYGR